VKVQQVAEDLGVRYVLEGSVQRSGGQIRINAQLIDATSGHHLWAERYERDTEDLFAVQAEIIETIVAIAEPAFQDANIVRRFQIRTNFANRLNSLGRCVEAIEQWSLALNAWPNFAMALGNRAYGICSYSGHLYDSGHAGIFLKSAANGYRAALANDAFWDSGPNERARTDFTQHLGQIDAYLAGIDFDHDFDMDGFSLGETSEEQVYREWCLKEGLFLNPLNDVSIASVAAQDVLHLPSHTYKIDERPRFPSYYNHLKQEYVSARFRLYQSIGRLDGHFIDKGVLILDGADGGEFGHHIDQLKTAFRSAYSLFDKIGLFLNDYFSVGIDPRKVYFQRIWAQSVKGLPKPKLHPTFENSRNWPLRGLYYLSKDLFDPEYSEFSSPDAKDIAALRNSVEHRFLTLQHYDTGALATDTHAYIATDDFYAKTLRIMKMARAALIYLSLAMFREEGIRAENRVEGAILPTIPSQAILRPWDID
jgi:hypothetical protein